MVFEALFSKIRQYISDGFWYPVNMYLIELVIPVLHAVMAVNDKSADNRAWFNLFYVGLHPRQFFGRDLDVWRLYMATHLSGAH